MKFLQTAITVFSLLASAIAAPAGDSESTSPSKRAGPFIWSNWSEGSGSWRCNSGADGSYIAVWSGTNGGFVCGKGWQPGGRRAVQYSGTYNPVGPGYLSLYGWTKNPLIEFYIVDSHGDLSPGEPWTSKGNFTTPNGEGTYALYQSTRTNKPSIVGTATFQQYWSVRTEKRVGGTITTGNHFDAWSKAGMQLGNFDYMILATEGYTNDNTLAKGNSSITVY